MSSTKWPLQSQVEQVRLEASVVSTHCLPSGVVVDGGMGLGASLWGCHWIAWRVLGGFGLSRLGWLPAVRMVPVRVARIAWVSGGRVPGVCMGGVPWVWLGWVSSVRL